MYSGSNDHFEFLNALKSFIELYFGGLTDHSLVTSRLKQT